MPAPAKVSLDAIIDTGRSVLEDDGEAGLTMQAVAARLGIRAPSLYKHVHDRAELVKLIQSRTLAELRADLDAVDGADPRERIVQLALAARSFGHRWPHGKAVLFNGTAASDDMSAVIAPVVDACRKVVGEEHALDAARTLTAWMHGFTEMEYAGGFRMGGDVDRAYEFGVRAIVDGVVTQATSARGR